MIPMTLNEDIMPYFDKFIHVYGWNLIILWPPLKTWTPKNFTIANIGHPVSKSWLSECCAVTVQWNLRDLNTLAPREKCSHYGVFTSLRYFHNVKDTNGTWNCVHNRRCSHLLGFHNERFHSGSSQVLAKSLVSLYSVSELCVKLVSEFCSDSFCLQL